MQPCTGVMPIKVGIGVDTLYLQCICLREVLSRLPVAQGAMYDFERSTSISSRTITRSDEAEQKAFVLGKKYLRPQANHGRNPICRYPDMGKCQKTYVRGSCRPSDLTLINVVHTSRVLKKSK